MPKGRLRESLEALKRADEIIITKSNYVLEGEVGKIKERLAKYGKPIFVATFKESYFYKLNFENNEKFGKMNSENKIGNEKLPLKVIQSRNVLIFSSIANPAVFYQTIKKLNPNNIEENPKGPAKPDRDEYGKIFRRVWRTFEREFIRKIRNSECVMRNFIAEGDFLWDVCR